MGIDSYFSILNSVVTSEEAMRRETAFYNITSTTEQIFRLIKANCTLFCTVNIQSQFV